jgi:hypothetical protein
MLSPTVTVPLDASTVCAPFGGMFPSGLYRMLFRVSVTVMFAPAPELVAIVAVAGIVTVISSRSSPLKVTAPAEVVFEATVAVAPLVIVPKARGAVAVAVIGVTIVAVVVIEAD